METDDAPYVACGFPSLIHTSNSAADCFMFPNPFHTSTVFSVNRQLLNADLFFYDVNGRAVKVIHNIEEGKTTITRDDLSNGVYFFTIIANGEILASGKVLVY